MGIFTRSIELLVFVVSIWPYWNLELGLLTRDCLQRNFLSLEYCASMHASIIDL